MVSHASIYQPAEDSWLLAAQVKKYASGKKVMDMGTGSGIQALTAKEAGASSVLAVDINRKALAEVQKKGISTQYSNLFTKVHQKFDLIMCNPPYLPADAQEDKASARATTGGTRGDEWILKFLAQAPKHLTKGGLMLLLLSSLTPRTKISLLLKKQKFRKRVIAQQKLFMEQLEVWEIQQR
ncbi:hypothetical protein EXS73_00520 [Candidatus Pacearchaeota archaeon]|nr:hypothetical protein [Candidatus Pacearchaeota archaeon]